MILSQRKTYFFPSEWETYVVTILAKYLISFWLPLTSFQTCFSSCVYNVDVDNIIKGITNQPRCIGSFTTLFSPSSVPKQVSDKIF